MARLLGLELSLFRSGVRCRRHRRGPSADRRIWRGARWPLPGTDRRSACVSDGLPARSVRCYPNDLGPRSVRAFGRAIASTASPAYLQLCTPARRSTSASAVGRLVRTRRRRQRSAPSAVGQGSEDVVSDPWIGASPKGVVRDVAAVVKMSTRRLATHLTSSCGEVAPRP